MIANNLDSKEIITIFSYRQTGKNLSLIYEHLLPPSTLANR